MKTRRHKLIKELIENEAIETQFQLTDELKKYGFDVTQATISRDIKELGLIKITSGENVVRYSLPTAGLVNNFDRTRRMFRDNILKVIPAENVVMIKTLPGMANAIATCLDGMGWQCVLGTVAGDDTIFALSHNKHNAQELVKKVHSCME